MVKEIPDEIPLIEAESEANNGLLASLPTKCSGISAIFTHHPSRAKVSTLMNTVHTCQKEEKEVSSVYFIHENYLSTKLGAVRELETYCKPHNHHNLSLSKSLNSRAIRLF